MNLRSFDAACAQFPGAVLSVQWGDEHVWKIGGKMFAWASPDRKPFACSMKASDIAREALTGQPGVRPAPYLARAGWLQIDHGAMPDREIADLLRVAHQLILSRLPKKTRARIEGD